MHVLRYIIQVCTFWILGFSCYAQTLLNEIVIEQVEIVVGASIPISESSNLPIYQIKVGLKFLNQTPVSEIQSNPTIVYELLANENLIEGTISLERSENTQFIETIRIHDFPNGINRGRLNLLDISNDLNSNDPIVLYLQVFSNDNIPLSTGSFEVNYEPSNQMISWEAVEGADEYEIEWSFIDEETVEDDEFRLPIKITTNQTSYQFDQVFPAGEILFSVQAIQINELDSGDIHTRYGAKMLQTLAIESSFEADKNWQYVASYAEEGKRKKIINYYDGLYRQRQSITTLSTDNTTIVRDYIFDHEGRPSLDVLSAPIRRQQLNYIPNFTQNTTGSSYDFEDFNASIINPMGNDSGAAKYYSPQNDLNNTIHRDYIPDANGYPFRIIEFTDDNTGRPRRSTGFGEAFQFDAESPHYTSYLYGKASNEQIQRLFGPNAGAASKYYRNLVVDPNGQVSVAYVDQYGRTVATALAGNTPSNLDTLASNIPDRNITLSFDMEGQLEEFNKRGLTEKVIKLGTNVEQFDFSYTLGGTSFEENFPMTMPRSYCVDCTYDLNIKIIDPHGNLLILTRGDNSTTEIVHTFIPPPNDCEGGLIPYLPIKFSATFQLEGEHTVIKELVLNNENIEATEALTLEILEQWNFYDDLDYQIEDGNCEEQVSDTPDVFQDALPICGMYVLQMVEDFKLGGWIFEDNSVFRAAFEEVSNLEPSNDEFSAYQIKQEIRVATHNNNTQRLNELIIRFLFAGHPEFCFFDFECGQEVWRDNTAYDSRFLSIDNYQEALDGGYFNPLDMPDLGSEDNMSNYIHAANSVDVFLVAPERADLKEDLIQELLNFIPKEMDGETVLAYYTLWEFLEHPELVITAKIPCTEDILKDRLLSGGAISDEFKWQIFKGIYQGLKRKVLDKYKAELCGDVERGPNPVFSTIYTATEDEILQISDEMQSENCQQLCEQKASTWVDALLENGCISIDSISRASLEEMLFDYCSNDCNNLEDGSYLLRLNQDLLQSLLRYILLSEHPDREYLEESLKKCIEEYKLEMDEVFPPAEISLSSLCREECFKDASLSPCLNSLIRSLPLAHTGGIQKIDNPIVVLQLKECLGLSDNHGIAMNIDETSLNFLWSYRTYARNTLEEYCEVRLYDKIGNLLSFSDISNLENARITQNKPSFSYTEAGYFTHIEVTYKNRVSQEPHRAYLFSTCHLPFLNTQCDPPYVTNACIGEWLNFEINEGGSDQTRAAELSKLCNEFRNGVFTDAMGNQCELMVYDRVGDKEFSFSEIVRLPNISLNKNTKWESEVADKLPGYTYTGYSDGDSKYFFFSNCHPGPPPCTAVPCPETNDLEAPEWNEEECVKAEIEREQNYRLDYTEGQVLTYWENFYTTNVQKCFDTPFQESFTYTTTDNEYHYTLFYYDQSGNLVQTVPPAGVDRLEANELGNEPNHRMVTRYWYNSRNQLIKQITPDGGTKEFWYNDAGLLRFSQNSDQALENEYSYTSYDEHARIIETGVIEVAEVSDIEAQLNSLNYPQEGDLERSEVVQHIYDDAANTWQRNLRNRIASSQTLDENEAVATRTDYSYDAHGNVAETRKFIQDLGEKRISYDYDLLSGNVNEVAYQKGEEDQFLHRYQYDADNRLTKVFSSRDGYLWHNDARYYYYAHGPLARKELGETNVQGMDYVYSLQGWLKGMNSNTLNSARDPGKDGLNGFESPIYQSAASDLYGYSLSYYNNDYTPIGDISLQNSFEAPIPDGSTQRDLYNGNIAYAMNAVNGMLQTHNSPTTYAYTYDQLNRLTGMQSFLGEGVLENNVWEVSNTRLGPYGSAYTYDANGNFESLKRWNANAQGQRSLMDNFTYRYTLDGSGDRLNNQLIHVNDSAPANLFEEDLDDQSDLANAQNYTYDWRGNMIADQAAGISEMRYNSYGKIQSITHRPDTGLPNISFIYDAGQHRVAKRLVYADSTITQYYLRDTDEKELVYYRADETGIAAEDYLLYGTERLGTIRHSNLIDTSLVLGRRNYYATNHLGSVMMSLSDLVTQNLSRSGQDYFPYGMNISSAIKSKYGFSGMEKENAISNYTTLFRQYDFKISNWTSIDPLFENYPSVSPYLGYNGNPNIYKDSKGSFLEDTRLNTEKVAQTRSQLSLSEELLAASVKGYLVGVVNGAAMLLSNLNAASCYDNPSGRIEYKPEEGDYSSNSLVDETYRASVQIGKTVGYLALLASPATKNRSSKPNVDQARWAQRTFRNEFGKTGKFRSQTVDELADKIAAGITKPKNVPIDAIVRDRKTFLLNTRSSASLTRAGVPRRHWRVKNRTGQAKYERMLDGQFQRNRRISGEGTFKIRESNTSNTVSHAPKSN